MTTEAPTPMTATEAPTPALTTEAPTPADVDVIHLPKFDNGDPVNAVFLVIPMILMIVLGFVLCQRKRRASHVLQSVN